MTMCLAVLISSQMLRSQAERLQKTKFAMDFAAIPSKYTSSAHPI